MQYVRALGFSPDDRLPSKTFQGTPMRHLGVHVGNFYLVEKAGGEAFTDEDEEILVLFAAQAATAIANARTYRAERRARADLEALIETSPVGVVVFEARTGALVSLNREAARIVKSCATPRSPPSNCSGSSPADPLARSAAVWYKSVVFSSLPIRKVLVLPLTETQKSKSSLCLSLRSKGHGNGPADGPADQGDRLEPC